MDNVGAMLVILGGIGIWYFIKKQKDAKKRNISIGLVVVGFLLVGIFGEPSDAEQATPESTVESTLSSSELQAIEESKEAERLAEEEAAAKAKEEEEKEKAEKEAAAKKLLEEIEKQEAAKKDPSAYETGITYDNLARTPDEHIGKKVKFYGKVLQVMETDGDYTQYRLAVNENYDTVAYLEISQDQLSTRILEDDIITVYGESYGNISYDSTMGGKITIPAIIVNMFEFH